MFVMAIVGSIFSYFGLLLLMQYLVFLRYGVKKDSRVVAIEKYISYDNKRREQTFYRAIAAFDCDGKKYYIKSGGSSNFNYEINQKIPYFILNNNPYNVLLNDGLYRVFIFVFLLIGWVAITFYLTSASAFDKMIFFSIYPIIPAIIIGLFIYSVKKDISLSGITKNSHVYETINFDDPNIYDTETEFITEKRRYFQHSYVFSLIITIFSSGVFALFWDNQKNFQKEEIYQYLRNIQEFNLDQLAYPSKPVVGFLVIFFFFLMGFISLVISLKNKH